MTYEESLAETKKILIKLFEIEEGKITPTANLFEDLELDSIDAIDVAVLLQKRTGKKITPEIFKSVRTVSDVAKVVCDLMNGKDPSDPAQPQAKQ